MGRLWAPLLLALGLIACTDEQPLLHLHVEHQPPLPPAQEQLAWRNMARLIEDASQWRVVPQDRPDIPSLRLRLEKRLGRHYLELVPSGKLKIRFEPDEGMARRHQRLRHFIQQVSESLPGR